MKDWEQAICVIVIDWLVDLLGCPQNQRERSDARTTVNTSPWKAEVSGPLLKYGKMPLSALFRIYVVQIVVTCWYKKIQKVGGLYFSIGTDFKSQKR